MREQIHSLLDGLSPRGYILPMKNQYSFLNGKSSSKVNKSLQAYSRQLTQMQQQYKLPRIAKNTRNENHLDQIRHQIKDLKAVLQEHNKQKLLEQKIQQKISELSLLGKSPYCNPYFPISLPISQFCIPVMQNGCFNCPKCINAQKIPNSLDQSAQKCENTQIMSKRIKTQTMQTQSKIIRQSPKQEKSRKLPSIPKMRKYVIAVFFTLYFPNFVQKFTRNRYIHFKQRYLKTQGAPIIQCSNLVRKSLLKNIDIPKIIQDYKAKKLQSFQLNERTKKKKKTILAKSRKNISNKGPLSQQKGDQLEKKKVQIKINEEQIQDNFIDNTVFFMNAILSEAYPILTNKKLLVKIYPLLSVGVLNGSFLMDNLLMSRQLEALKFQIIKGYMIATPEKQRLLLMNLLITKILIGHVLFKSYGKGVRGTAGQLNENQQKNIKEVVQTGATFLYLFCMEIFDDFVKKQHQNLSASPFIENLSNSLTKCVYADLNSKFKVKPSYSINVEKDSEMKKKLNKVRFKQFIVGIPHLQQVQKITLQNTRIQAVKGQIKSKIIALIEEVQERLHSESHISFYDQIKEITLNQKHIISKGNSKWITRSSQNRGFQYSQLLSRNLNSSKNPRLASTRNFKQESNIAHNNSGHQRLSNLQIYDSKFNKKEQFNKENAMSSRINLPSLQQTNLKKNKAKSANRQNQSQLNIFPSFLGNQNAGPLTHNDQNLIYLKSSRNQFSTKETKEKKSVGYLQKYQQLMKRMKHSQRQVHH